jgi:transposase
MTDGEWAAITPLLPGCTRLDRRCKVELGKVEVCDVWDAIQYSVTSGCAWPLVPKDFPSVSKVQYYFYRWRNGGLLARINRELVVMARIAEGRLSQPTAGVIDRQSVKTTENTSLSGYDASKRIKGRKRRITIDTSGHMIALTMHGAHIQDRDGAPEVFARLRREALKRHHVFADGGYGGLKLPDALIDIGHRTIQIIKRSAR